MSLTKQRKERAFALLREDGYSDEEILEIRDSKPKQSRVNRSNLAPEIYTLIVTLGTITRDQIKKLPSCPSDGPNQRKTIGRAMSRVRDMLVESGHGEIQQPDRNSWCIAGLTDKDYELGAMAEKTLIENGRVDIMTHPFKRTDAPLISKYLKAKGYEEGTHGIYTRNDI